MASSWVTVDELGMSRVVSGTEYLNASTIERSAEKKERVSLLQFGDELHLDRHLKGEIEVRWAPFSREEKERRFYLMEMEMILISSKGLSCRSVLTWEIFSTMSMPLLTRPKMVCFLSSHGDGTTVTKNCDPFVFGPALAMDSVYGRSCFNSGWNSSWKSLPQIDWPPVPLPSGSPRSTRV